MRQLLFSMSAVRVSSSLLQIFFFEKKNRLFKSKRNHPEFSSFRYDCRSHLFDLTPWDSDLIRSRKTNSNDEEIFDENQRQIEIECENERYADLYRDVGKEIENKEEEDKRISVEINSFGQVPFSYDESTIKSDEVPPPPPPPPDDDEYEPFYPSEKLQIPYGMEIVRSFVFRRLESNLFV